MRSRTLLGELQRGRGLATPTPTAPSVNSGCHALVSGVCVPRAKELWEAEGALGTCVPGLGLVSDGTYALRTSAVAGLGTKASFTKPTGYLH